MAYTWDNAMQEGRRRLALLEQCLDPGTFRRLETIGGREGWRCLDVGAGGGTVCDWQVHCVGATGRVCAVDVVSVIAKKSAGAASASSQP